MQLHRQNRRDRALRALARAKDNYLDEVHIFDDFIGDTLSSIWNTTGSGTVTIVSDTAGILQLETTLIAQTNRVDYFAKMVANVSMEPILEFPLKVNATTNVKNEIGMSAGTTDVDDSIWFENDAGASAVNWFGKVRNGVTLTTVDLGIVLTTAKRFFGFQVDNTAGVVNFFIAAAGSRMPVWRGSVKATLPTGNMEPIVIQTSNVNASRTTDLDFYSLTLKRPLT